MILKFCGDSRVLSIKLCETKHLSINTFLKSVIYLKPAAASVDENSVYLNHAAEYVGLPTTLSSILKSNDGLTWKCDSCLHHFIQFDHEGFLKLFDERINEFIRTLNNNFEKLELYKLPQPSIIKDLLHHHLLLKLSLLI